MPIRELYFRVEGVDPETGAVTEIYAEVSHPFAAMAAFKVMCEERSKEDIYLMDRCRVMSSSKWVDRKDKHKP